MAVHRFKVGQTVALSAGFGTRRVVAKITRLMPSGREEGDPQYRVKDASENHERVAAESGMTKLD
ncbi:hypothetical protein [Hansschlegelia sp.]|uniref:hypothetical protein n=1 Tax=Hansschlegelia sp. TaxID=2041892 RepID=UPI002C889382|nr:hypothetical protein [Hansschlegelia sp.]HVI30160.1 hypothetical protein [Hansschlegelia sp.]